MRAGDQTRRGGSNWHTALCRRSVEGRRFDKEASVPECAPSVAGLLMMVDVAAAEVWLEGNPFMQVTYRYDGSVELPAD